MARLGKFFGGSYTYVVCKDQKINGYLLACIFAVKSTRSACRNPSSLYSATLTSSPSRSSRDSTSAPARVRCSSLRIRTARIRCSCSLPPKDSPLALDPVCRQTQVCLYYCLILGQPLYHDRTFGPSWNCYDLQDLAHTRQHRHIDQHLHVQPRCLNKAMQQRVVCQNDSVLPAASITLPVHAYQHISIRYLIIYVLL